MQHVQLYYTYFDQPLAAKKFQSYLYTLPTDLQIKIQKFIRWQDQHASLFGRLLLQCGLQPYQYHLQQLKYTEYNRPFINQKAGASHWVTTRCAIMSQLNLVVPVQEAQL